MLTFLLSLFSRHKLRTAARAELARAREALRQAEQSGFKPAIRHARTSCAMAEIALAEASTPIRKSAGLRITHARRV